MKILQITFSLAPGGAERFVVDLSNELVKKHEVVLMTLMDDKVSPDINQFYLFDLSKKVRYKNLGIKRGGGFSLRVLWKIYKAMKQERADIIHLHVHSVVNFCIIGILFLCWKTTIVQTIHTDFNVGHSSILYKFLFRTIGRLHRMRWVALSQRNYDDMIAVYPYLFCERIDNGRAPMIPTPLYDDVKKEIASFRLTEKTKVFLHVGRCADVKNQKMLVSAFNRFRDAGNDAILLIVGGNFETETGKIIKEMAKDGVFFLGTRKNISDYMLNVDCFCLSSLFEGLPITILESLLSGIPVVTTPVKGALDVVDDGKTGIISKDFTEDEYVFALERAINHMTDLKENANMQKDTSPYTIHECSVKYERFYKLLSLVSR